MKRLYKTVALLLIAALLLFPAVPFSSAEEDTNTVAIRTAEDLTALSRNCSLDSWSRGKTVLLERDVDLTGSEFQPIPTFGGTFDGQGHVISGLTVSGSGNAQGLFRYIQPEGLVSDLTVKGTVSPSNLGDSIGGIAGENRGQLLRCTFHGTVKGDTSVGGIAGINEAEGQLINCSFSGAAEGDLHVGGIAGQNLGSLIRCTNEGDINTAEKVHDDSQEKSALKENLTGRTDVGGIAGYSAGILQSCQNNGAVGYPHIGYNIGGVAGRQSGYLDGCTNRGTVSGRKDVGGITGQLEPEVTVLFNESFLRRLGDELDVLQELADGLLEDASSISDDLSSQMQTVSDQTRAAKDAAEELGDAMTGWADEGISQINDLSARISKTLDQLDPVLDETNKNLEKLTDTADDLSQILEDTGKLGDLGSESVRQLRLAIREISSISDRYRQALTRLSDAAEALRNALGDMPQMKEAFADLSDAARQLHRILPDSLRSASDHLKKSLQALEEAGMEADEILSSLNDTGSDISDIFRELSDNADSIYQIVDDLFDEPAISIPTIDSTITAQSDALDDAFSSLSDQMENLGSLIDASADTLSSDLEIIGSQFGVITDLIRNEGSRMQETEMEDRFSDISDQGGTEDQTAGRVSASRNEGAVEGDINVAGIAGVMAIDRDFDPEDDLIQEGDRSPDFWLQTKASVFSCVNAGPITGKKDYTGGITGRMDMGIVQNCESYGDVTSTGGSYVGGISGASWGTIRSCWSRCILSGDCYIGGIAGLGSDLVRCRSLAEISEGEAFTGTIAGNIENDSSVTGNLFSGKNSAAIDGISYAGKAEPVSLDELCLLPDVPEDFAQMTLTFVADGETVSVLSVTYGEGLEVLPAPPAKEGCSASWPDLDYSCITASQTIEAIYTPYTSALSAGGDLPRILVDGSFSPNAEVSYENEEISWSDENGQSHSGTAWTVTVEDPELDIDSCTIHYRLPEDGSRWTVWVLDNDRWQIREHEIDGRYLLLTVEGAETTFCVLPRPFPLHLILFSVILVALAALLIFLAHRRRKTKRSEAA